jgi:hypothetical protein
MLQRGHQAPPSFTILSTGESSPALSIMRIDYTAPWNVRYWAEDYAQEAMETVISAGYWPAGSLTVEHTDPASPTHWRVKMADGPGFSQPGW